MSLQTFRVFVAIGEPFPENGETYHFEGKNISFTGTLMFPPKPFKWRTKGKIGVVIEVIALCDDVKRNNSDKPKLRIVEQEGRITHDGP